MKMVNFLQLISEVLFGIRAVKMCGWAAVFATKIDRIRRLEWRQLAIHKYIDAVFVYLWASAPVAIAFALFVTFDLMGGTLTAAKVGRRHCR